MLVSNLDPIALRVFALQMIAEHWHAVLSLSSCGSKRGVAFSHGYLFRQTSGSAVANVNPHRHPTPISNKFAA